jgi:outer membrane receptor protein involved in Fe transport
MKKKFWILSLFVSICYTGFAQEEPVLNDSLFNLSLEELMNVEVTVASKNAEKITDAGGVISVITREELDRFGGLTLRDALERVPSLNAIRANFLELYGVAVRGQQVKSNSGHILILINGRPIREILDGSMSGDVFAAFPVDAIERIEVIRGPGSVLYGTNAFSSVINLVTKVSDENNGVVSALMGPDGGVGANGQGTINLGDLRISLAGRYLDKSEQSVGLQTNNPADPANPNNYVLNLKDKASSAFADIQYKQLRGTFMQNAHETTHLNNIGNVFQNGGATNKYDRRYGNIGYNLAVTENWDMDFNTTASYHVFESDPTTSIKRRSTDALVEWTNHITLGESAQLVAGALYNYNKGFSTVAGNVTSDLNRGALAMYTQIDYWMLENLKLIAGFQANKVEDEDMEVLPRGGVVWYPVPKLSFKALYGQAYRAPTIYETGVNSPFLLGNTNLKPEEVSSIDFGINYQGNRFQLGVNYFNNKQTNIINFTTIPNTTRLTYDNLSEISFQGIEFEAKYYILNNLFFTGSALYQENVTGTDVWSTTPISSFGAKAGLSYESTKGLTVSLFDIYQGDLGGVYKATATTLNPADDHYNMLNLYAALDFFKMFNVDKSYNASVFVQADNILDAKVWAPASGSFSATAYPLNAGRTVYFGIKAAF